MDLAFVFEETQTFFFFFCKAQNRQGSSVYASAPAAALTCVLPPAVDNWPLKIWARTFLMVQTYPAISSGAVATVKASAARQLYLHLIPQHTCWAHLPLLN